MLRYLPIAAAVLLMGAVAVVQGTWTERWGRFDTEAVSRRVEALERVPMNFGRWEGHDQELDERQLKIAKVSGVVQRIYRNIDTGQEVSVYLATGKARAVSVHTPDKCYAAAGFRQNDDQVAVPVPYGDGRSAELYTSDFRKDSPEGTIHLRIFWTWNANGTWEAPAVPKVTFAKYPALYKMYVIRVIRPGEQYVGDDPSVEFLKEFFPIVDRELGDTAESGQRPDVASSDSRAAA